MSSIVKNKEVWMLDPRVKPEWELLDLREETGDYEHELFSSVATEFVDIAGFDCDYYIRKPKKFDVIYGESPLSNYFGPFKIKLVFEVPNDNVEIDRYGFGSGDILQYAEMAKASYQRDVMLQIDMNEDITYPRTDRKPYPSDLIKTLWDDKLWEVSHVSEGQRIFHGMKLTWSLILIPFVFSHEGIDAETALYSEPDKDDFPDVNLTTIPRTEADLLEDNKNIDKEHHKNLDETGTDTSIYGYDVL